ncbi:Sugar fermentation stimulation protein-like protein, partial [Frankliniella fusca]
DQTVKDAAKPQCQVTEGCERCLQKRHSLWNLIMKSEVPDTQRERRQGHFGLLNVNVSLARSSRYVVLLCTSKLWLTKDLSVPAPAQPPIHSSSAPASAEFLRSSVSRGVRPDPVSAFASSAAQQPSAALGSYAGSVLSKFK